MDLQNIFKIYNILKKDDFSFIYRGIFSNNILNRITSLFNNISDISNRSVNNKLTYLTIESFQNVIRYSETKSSSSQSSDLFIFRKITSHLFIITTNLINKKRARNIEKRLEELNSLPPEELKKLYVEILTNKSFSEKGGAGLGFIEMLRKSKNRLQYKFLPYNNEFDYFYFQLQLSLHKDQKLHQLPISQSVEINQINRQLNSLLIFKSTITSNNIVPIVQIINHNINSSIYSFQKKLFTVLVELLQDLAQINKNLEINSEAIFILGKNKDNYYILLGNQIDEKILQNKLNLLEKYTKLNKEKLDEIYYDKLLDDNTPEYELRLIKILSSSQNYEYLVTQLTENCYFFSQKIEIPYK